VTLTTLGIDLASQPAGTAACLVEWPDRGAPVVHEPIKKLDDDALIAMAQGCDVVGIDAPFGWPSAFVELISAHHAGVAPAVDWTDDDARRALRLRRCDRWLWKESGLGGRAPLSVSTDLISLPAMRCIGLLRRLGVTDRSGGRIVEVYPAAALRRWTRDPAKYKGRTPAAATKRAALRLELERRLGLSIPPSATLDDDRLDAVVAACVARAAHLGHTMAPAPVQLPHAQREGWIHVPGIRPDDPRLAFLREHQTQTTGHSDRTLLEHLLGTWQLLADWGNPAAVCNAGLFHSVYGTESFQHAAVPTSLRPQVRALIGERAERVAWLFGRRTNVSFAANASRSSGHTLADRSTGATLPLSPQDWQDLCEVFVANAIEQKAAVDPDRVRDVTARFSWIAQHTSAQAAEAWRRSPEDLV